MRNYSVYRHMLRQLKLYFLFIAVAFTSVLPSCQNQSVSDQPDTVYFCGAENQVTNEDGSIVFENEGHIFEIGEVQSADFSFEGQYSVKLDKQQKYGFSYAIYNVKKGELINAAVWQKVNSDKGTLICSVSGESKFTIESRTNGFYEEQRGWRKHFIQLEAVRDLDTVHFFVFSQNADTALYFDNFSLERLHKRPDRTEAIGDLFSIYMTDSSKEVLDGYVNAAINEEIIRDELKEYVLGTLKVDSTEIPIEIRLKGDWTDHLLTGTVSYRIKTKSGTAFKGLRSFSIQHPRTRNYMDEWFMHKLCDQEGLLSTSYSFVQTEINYDYQGVYALEEHFDKQLIESRNRREGPILKFDETAFWALAVLAREKGLETIDLPFFEASLIGAFKEKRVRKSKKMFGDFWNGTLLLEDFKFGSNHPELLFDMDLLAKYYALMDLGNVSHSLAWHNRRFYYNPVTCMLEHIGFDMIPMSEVMYPTLAAQEFRRNPETSSFEAALGSSIFRNQSFRKKYIQNLQLFSSEVYLDSMFTKFEQDILLNESILKTDLPSYFFNKEKYYQKAKMIRNELITIGVRWDEYEKREQKVSQHIGRTYDTGNSSFYFKPISISAYRSTIDSVHYQIELENFHFDSVDVIGYSINNNKDSIIPFDTIVRLKGFLGGRPADYGRVQIPAKPSRVFYRPHNLDGEIKAKKLIKWEKPKGEHPRLLLNKRFKTSSAYYTISNKELTFKTGSYTINELIYIPSEYTVKFNSGTKIDFVNRGGLILNGTTNMIGTAANKIEFTSSDSTGMGITILKADEVNVDYVSIENMSCLDFMGWTLTGAFTIYESNVSINNLEIRGNSCEDVLNIIRSYFKIENCLIENTHGDGFDADFCTGSFTDSKFKNTGNDCIDFSGSVVNIERILIQNSGDKGVSAGERSTLTLKDIKIYGALTGLASKDDSHIKAENILLENAEVGLALFQKKPEYAPSTIELKNGSYQNVNQLGLIEKGSKLIYEGRTFKGYQKFDIDKMYARFEKK